MGGCSATSRKGDTRRHPRLCRHPSTSSTPICVDFDVRTQVWGLGVEGSNGNRHNEKTPESKGKKMFISSLFMDMDERSRRHSQSPKFCISHESCPVPRVTQSQFTNENINKSKPFLWWWLLPPSIGRYR